MIYIDILLTTAALAADLPHPQPSVMDTNEKEENS